MADIFRQHGPAWRASRGFSRENLRVMRAIERCRTAALGGHVDRCGHCSHTRISYNSCRNRHCPKCQSLARARWLEQRRGELLPVEYFHVVFTIPEQVAGIAFQNQQIVYDILFRAASETLLTIARDRKHLGAETGFFSVLHTWGQNLLLHPHLHCVVPGGGISPDRDRWVSCRPGFFLPVRVLSRLFRRLFLDYLAEAHERGLLFFFGDLSDLGDAGIFTQRLQTLEATDWVVYAKPPFGGPTQVLEYLGRYTHRVAISNERLCRLENGQVSFRWKDYRHGSRKRIMTVEAEEFMRRFLLHTLPPGFRRIRHYGLLASRHRSQSLELCRRLLSNPVTDLLPHPRRDWTELYLALTGIPINRCPRCGLDSMYVVEVLLRMPRPGPPAQDSS